MSGGERYTLAEACELLGLTRARLFRKQVQGVVLDAHDWLRALRWALLLQMSLGGDYYLGEDVPSWEYLRDLIASFQVAQQLATSGPIYSVAMLARALSRHAGLPEDGIPP